MNIRHLTAMIIPLALTAVAGSGSRPLAQDAADAAPIVVPFQMLPSNHMVVEAKFNGKGPYRMIFDLGAPVTLLSNKAATAVKAIGKNAPRSIFMSTRGEGHVDTVELGALKAKDLPVIVMDHPALTALSGFFEKPIEGIIGYTFWARYKMSIDYKAKELTFTPVKFQVRNLMKDLPTQLAGPKVAKKIVLEPHALWGLVLGDASSSGSEMGLPIKTVYAESPASIAGLKPGDRLTTLDGRWTTTIADAFHAAARATPNQAVEVVVLRDGKEVAVKVTPRDGI